MQTCLGWSCVPVHEPTPASFIHNVTSRRTDNLSPSHCIAGSNILVCPRKVADMEPQLTIGEPDVRNAPFSSDMHAAWAHYSRLSTTWDMHYIRAATREQSSNEQLYLLDIKHVCLVSNCRVGNALVANQQVLSQVPTSVLCDSFSVSNSLNARFVDVLA